MTLTRALLKGIVEGVWQGLILGITIALIAIAIELLVRFWKGLFRFLAKSAQQLWTKRTSLYIFR